MFKLLVSSWPTYALIAVALLLFGAPTLGFWLLVGAGFIAFFRAAF